MPKKAGIGKNSSKLDWKKKRRQEHLEKKKYRYYIFCEGEQTEPQYFSGFKHLIEDNPAYRDMVLIEIEPCAAETMRVIGMAEKYVSKNGLQKGQIWCVYDKDSFPASDFNGVVKRAEQLSKENPELQYHAAWSNECIEFWFLLHFAYYISNNHRLEYISFLNEKFTELGLGKYQKNMKNIFEILMERGDRNWRYDMRSGLSKTVRARHLQRLCQGRGCMSWWRNWRNICRKSSKNDL